MPHLVLLGDSILDNGAYTDGGPDVVAQIRARLPIAWRVTLNAVDGATTAGVPAQLARLPGDATHLVLSVGGNDALGHMGVLATRLQSMAAALALLADARDAFEEGYRPTLEACLATGRRVAVCTIYGGCFPDADFQRQAGVALTVFNDVILRTVLERRLPVIDLRPICCEPRDYANPIEPSSIGGAKIADAIVRLVTSQSPPDGCPAVVGR